MFGYRVTSEQGHKLADRLRERDIAHGDVAQEVVLVGVGVNGTFEKTHFAFCPTLVQSVGEVKHASQKERALPMPTEAHFRWTSRRDLHRALHDKRGFATLSCKIWGNGRLNLEDVKVLEFMPVPGYLPINTANSYRDYLAGINT